MQKTQKKKQPAKQSVSLWCCLLRIDKTPNDFFEESLECLTQGGQITVFALLGGENKTQRPRALPMWQTLPANAGCKPA